MGQEQLSNFRIESLETGDAARKVADIVREKGSWGLTTTFTKEGLHRIGETNFEVRDNSYQLIPLGGIAKTTGTFGSIEMSVRGRVQPTELASRRIQDQLLVMAYDLETNKSSMLNNLLTAARQRHQANIPEGIEKKLEEQTAIIIQFPKKDEKTSLVAITIVLPSDKATTVLKYMDSHLRFGIDIVDRLVPDLDREAQRELDLKSVRIVQDRKKPFLPLRDRSDKTISFAH